MGEPKRLRLLLLLLLLCAFVLPHFAVGYVSSYPPCNSQCSLDEMNNFWGECCSVYCIDGVYQNLPDGIDASDSLPWWACSNIANAYILFTSSSILLWVFYINFWFWYNGHALFPTSIVELSRRSTTTSTTTNSLLGNISNNSNNNSNEWLDRGPKTMLSGWRVVRNVSLSSKTVPCDEQKQLQNQHQEQQQQQQQQPRFIKYEYSATIELYNITLRGTADTRPIDITLKSYAAHKQLQEYSEARQGRCWTTTTTNDIHPTNGYHLITFAPDHNELLLYRPYFYHSRWKFESLFFGIPCVLTTLGFWSAVPVLRTFKIILLTNAVALLLAGMGFFMFGHHRKDGQCPIPIEDQPRNSNYFEMRDNPGLTPVV